ncbi:2,5-dichloro-2,5-cyclohexadiene-1,4-diol dehydrogenase [Xylaria arbuscula]|uniref:Uncharacterized protein n=1 Tax=Xylaria arbuscula TaxID=114810 RepID=A0A9W8TJX2_9PEZI|nr:2,5-dichloro-2,5-cyclohexadiene-1,4-diol dehydrogenase [Xylaria arbuscula]KAJ3567752.1 hypothetical protein NPX13_g6662 [Xylaria arbuscula]
MFRFVGRTAIVTGAGSGIGKAVAEQLAGEGARIIALDTSFPKIDNGPNRHIDLLFSSSNFVKIYHDASNPDHWDELLITLGVGGVDGVDILINAANIMHYKPLDEMEYSDRRRIIGVNAEGIMLGMRAIIPLIKAQGGGSIVNFSSALATMNPVAYAAGKGAVMFHTRNAAVTYGADNIRVNAILFGIIDTPMARAQEADYNDTLVVRTPLRRMGTVREVARCVLFMASDEAGLMTGSAVTVDGGVSIL